MFRMKNTFVVLCLLVTIINIQGVPRASRTASFMKNLLECKEKIDAKEDDVHMLVNRQRLTTRSSQCLMACIKKKTGQMLEDNTINLESSLDSLKSLKAVNKRLYDKLSFAFQFCKEKEVPEQDECEAASKFSECIINIRDN